jgi:hypothetical protein
MMATVAFAVMRVTWTSAGVAFQARRGVQEKWSVCREGPAGAREIYNGPALIPFTLPFPSSTSCLGPAQALCLDTRRAFQCEKRLCTAWTTVLHGMVHRHGTAVMQAFRRAHGLDRLGLLKDQLWHDGLEFEELPRHQIEPSQK